jgi:hypothetical protein
MGLWKPPVKVRLPSHHDRLPSKFGYNGHMPDGRQILAYTAWDPHNWREPNASGQGWYRWIAALHVFDADGHHLSSQQRTAGGPFTDRPVADAAGQSLLRQLVEPYVRSGWQPGDIWVRLFYINIDGWPHGLVYVVRGEGLEDECGGDEGEPNEGEQVTFKPFDFAFRPPYDDGSYDS